MSFFPHLIAGPVLHHAQMMPQFETNRQIGRCGCYLLLGIVLILFCPNSKQLAESFRPTGWRTAGTALMLALAVIYELAREVEPTFLYFDF